MSSLALPILDADLEERLRIRMDEVERALHDHVESEAPFVLRVAGRGRSPGTSTMGSSASLRCQ